MSASRAVGVEILDIIHADDLNGRETFVRGSTSGGSITSNGSSSANSGSSIATSRPSRRVSFDANSYLLILQVWIPAEQHNYTLTRTYKSLVTLQMQLCKKYPRSNIPSLPKTVELTPNKKVILNEYISQLMNISEILQSDTFLSYLDASSAEGELLDYDALALELVTCIDVILEDEKDVEKVIVAGREYQVKMLDVAGESVVVWRFSTHARDIGFSVLYNETEVVKYQRLEAQNKPINGLFEVPCSAIDANGQPCDSHDVILKFDNSYSKLRSKALTYTVRTVSYSDYLAAVQKAKDVNQTKEFHQRQRSMLKAALLIASRRLNGSGQGAVGLGMSMGSSMSMSGSTVLTSVLADNLHSQETGAPPVPLSLSSAASFNSCDSLASLAQTSGQTAASSVTAMPAAGLGTEVPNAQRLLDEKAGLISAYQEALQALETERQAAASALSRLDKTATLLDRRDEELLHAREELELLKEAAQERDQNYQTSLAELSASQGLALDALGDHKVHLEELHDLRRLNQDQKERLSALTATIEQLTLSDLNNQEQIKILKTEKKQLRKFGLQSKADLERLTAVNAALETEVAALQAEASAHAADMRKIHTELQELQWASARATQAPEAFAAHGAGQTETHESANAPADPPKDTSCVVKQESSINAVESSAHIEGAGPQQLDTSAPNLESKLNSESLKDSGGLVGRFSRGLNGALPRPGVYVDPPPLLINQNGTFFGF